VDVFVVCLLEGAEVRNGKIFNNLRRAGVIQR
jgi:hypothetical protein